MSEDDYKIIQAAYDLKKLRGKGFIDKVEKSIRYRASEKGLRTMAALLILKEKVIKPVLHMTVNPINLANPINPTDILDIRYSAVQAEMKKLMNDVGIAA